MNIKYLHPQIGANMEKAVINLDKWGLMNCNNWFCAFGIADNHPKLGKNVEVSHTSEILNIEEKEDTYYLETHNSIYVCKLGDISKESHYRLEKTESKSKVAKVYNKYYRYKIYNLSKESEEPISKYGIRLKDEEIKEFERILKLTAFCDKEREESIKLHEARLLEEASKYSDSIFIDLSSISRGSKLAFNIKGKTGIVNPSVHLGIFTDTVLYEKSEKEIGHISFRYYVGYKDLTPYSWSENIERIVIHNNKGTAITFGDKILIKPDETVEILRKDYYKIEKKEKVE